VNKTAIEWADFSWNPIVGCLNGCGVTAANPAGWCYARRLATTRLAHLCCRCATFEPHLHPERLDQPLHVKKPALIFADSMSDWWSPGVEDEWLGRVLAVMAECPQHRFIVLTKRPERITAMAMRFWPSNAWLGVSITSGDDWWRWEALAKLPERIHRFVSVEPLMPVAMVGQRVGATEVAPSWVIVGPMSGPGAVHPFQSDVSLIREACAARDIPLFEKPNLPIQPPIRQMPPGLAAVYRKGGLT
jgi:protein gp37